MGANGAGYVPFTAKWKIYAYYIVYSTGIIEIYPKSQRKKLKSPLFKII